MAFTNSLNMLYSKSTTYMAYEFSGEGCYGKVARCVDLHTGDQVAVKILRECGNGDLEKELKAYEALRALDPDKNNFVRFIENFKFNGHSCLAFEMLDQSLWDVVDENGWCVNDIRPVTHQILVALKALADIGMVHTDIKPDNIMLVNHRDQPFRVKLIDFGLAAPVNTMQVGTLMQPYGYRAPEVMLGLPLSEAIDMWGLGCTLASIYLGRNIFPTDSSYNLMMEMMFLLGPPEEHLLLAGMYTCRHLIREPHLSNPTEWIWRFKRQSEYEQAQGIKLEHRHWPRVHSLEQAVQKSSRDDSEYHDGMQFVDLVKSCLHWDAAKRITPSEALKHSFVTMAHLDQKNVTSSYRRAAHQLMTVYPMEPSDDGLSAAAGPTDGATAITPVNTHGLTKKKKKKENLFQRTLKFFRRVRSRAETTSHETPTGSSATTKLLDGFRDTAALIEEESPVATSDDSADTDCVATVSNSNEDRPSAAAGSSDGATAITPVNMHGLTKKKKKNLFQRTLKFFRRVTTNLRDEVRDTAAPAEEESAAE